MLLLVSSGLAGSVVIGGGSQAGFQIWYSHTQVLNSRRMHRRVFTICTENEQINGSPFMHVSTTFQCVPGREGDTTLRLVAS